jgi:protein-S-isoprenylcysteine O-methyltransferase Ste14
MSRPQSARRVSPQPSWWRGSRGEAWVLGQVILMALVFLGLKSRREETWLLAKYPEYAHYQLQVSKLIPFIY